MRLLCGSLLLLSACAATSEVPEKRVRYRADRPDGSTKEQKELIQEVMTRFWIGDEEYDASVARCARDPEVAHALAMLMVVKMSDTERLQRRKQGVDFQFRTLDENIPYVRARDTFVRLGEHAWPVIEELIRHPLVDQRHRGIELLSRMPPSVLPRVRERFDQCDPPRLRRHYVEAVARMKPVPETELMLLSWAKHEDYNVRAAALVGLAGFGSRHLELLREVVRTDPDPFVQRQVVKQLHGFKDRGTAAVVVGFYERAAQRGDRVGIREAERVLVEISGSPRARGRHVIHYGLEHWRKWLAAQPVVGGKR